jgi:uncharacterized protein
MSGFRFPLAGPGVTAASLALLGLLNAPGAAQTTRPSFDCSAADGEVEELICSDDGLAALDIRLAEVFGQAVEVIEGFPPALTDEELPRFRTEQRGWISGRNDCWKADDVRACTEDEYKRRIAELQAGYRLVDSTATVFWTCDGNPSNEFVTTFFPTDPPSAVVERGDRSEVAIQTPTASGARYDGPFGAWFWTKGDEATAEWPQGEEHNCVVRERR